MVGVLRKEIAYLYNDKTKINIVYGGSIDINNYKKSSLFHV